MVEQALQTASRHHGRAVRTPPREVRNELGEQAPKLVTFTPDEWERVNSLHKKVNKYTTRYRSFTVFARKMLTDGEIRVTEIRPLTDPEPLAREIGRIGVNVNQIAHWANANEHITAEQVAELRASFDRIERLLGDLFANKRTAGKDVGAWPWSSSASP